MKNINKRFLSFLLCLSPSLVAMADSVLVLELNDGKKEAFVFESSPRMGFEGDDLKVTFLRNALDCTISHPRSDIARFYFEDESVGIGDVQSDTTTQFLGKGLLRVSGINSREIKAYDTSGKQVPIDIKVEGDGAIVSLSNLPTGMYIVKYGKSSIKVFK